MELDNIKAASTIIAAIVGLLALLKGVYELSKNSSLKRAEHFLEQRKRLKTDEKLLEISFLIELRDPKLSKVSLSDKLYYTGFFEEIAILMNSGLIRKEIAHYMFGYYAIRMWESDLFWSDLNRNMKYWAILRDFIAQMESEEQSFSYSRKKYRL